MLTLIITVLLLGNCGIKTGPAPDDVPGNIEDRLEAIKTAVIKAGGVADIGVAQSRRRDIARKKARIEGENNIAKIYETRINSLGKKFMEEVGSGADVEINELFSDVIKSVVKHNLSGAYPKKVEFLTEYEVIQENAKDKKVPMFTCYTLMAIEPTTMNQSLFDQLAKKDHKTYERFRSSKAFDELEIEMKNYEDSEFSN